MPGYGDFSELFRLMQMVDQQQQREREQKEREERRRREEEEHAVRMESEKLEAIRKEIEEYKRLAELGILSQEELDARIARARKKLDLPVSSVETSWDRTLAKMDAINEEYNTMNEQLNTLLTLWRGDDEQEQN